MATIIIHSDDADRYWTPFIIPIQVQNRIYDGISSPRMPRELVDELRKRHNVYAHHRPRPLPMEPRDHAGRPRRPLQSRAPAVRRTCSGFARVLVPRGC